MKKIVLILTVLLTHLAASGIALTQEEEEFISRVKVTTCNEALMWFGLDWPDTFDSTKLTQAEQKSALKKGLPICEERAKYGMVTYQVILAKYYLDGEDKNLRKSLYWAHQAADQGDQSAMELLCSAYWCGNGVVKDTEEGIKWCFLGASLGSESLKKRLNELITSALEFPEVKVIVDEAQRRANLWMKQHPNAFFSPE